MCNRVNVYKLVQLNPKYISHRLWSRYFGQDTVFMKINVSFFLSEATKPNALQRGIN